MATVTNDTDEVRRRMAEIRLDLHHDVREVVAGAEAVTDWQRYVRMYPWAAAGAALGIGYVIVPRRARAHPAPVAALVEHHQAVASTPAPSRKSVMGFAFGLLGPVAVRAAQSYAVQFLEGWIASQMANYIVPGGAPPDGPQGPNRASAGPSSPDLGGRRA